MFLFIGKNTYFLRESLKNQTNKSGLLVYWKNPCYKNTRKGFEPINSRVPLIEVLMITKQGYWLLMVKIELCDRLKLIKHQTKIF